MLNKNVTETMQPKTLVPVKILNKCNKGNALSDFLSKVTRKER